VLLVVGTSLLTLTTSPVALTDALERIMRPLARIGFPAGEVAMMLTIALRFIPTTAQEAEKIVVAQTARGARFDEGGLVRRARAYIPVLVPLFVNLFRRADDLATAMEIITKRGAFFSYNDTRLGQGRENAKEFLRQNIELCDEIEGVVRQRAMGGEFAFDLSSSSDDDSSSEE
jgi:energy-coupling factor transport system permease protein